MNYPIHDTDWSTSTQGNEWKRVDGKVLIAGRKKPVRTGRLLTINLWKIRLKR
jgi:hypothetical protein